MLATLMDTPDLTVSAVAELRLATRIPLWALYRHLNKLERRAFAACCSDTYVAVERPDALGRELTRLATNQ